VGRHEPRRTAAHRRPSVLSRAGSVVTRPLDWAGHVGAVVWRSLFGTAAALCLAAGILHAIGRVDDAYAAMLVAGALGAVATFFGLLALRVEPDTTPIDAEALQ
jgi:hypothetical protein